MSSEELAREAGPCVKNHRYRPNPKTAMMTGNYKLVTVSSPGDWPVDDLAREVQNASKSPVQIPLSFTTRAPRCTEGHQEEDRVDYRFYDDKREAVLRDLRNGNLVHAVLDSDDHLYGTYLGDYDSTRVNLEACTPGEVLHLEEQRLFARITKTFVVPNSTKEFMKWILPDDELSNDLIRKRLIAAESSIEQALEPDLEKRFLFVARSCALNGLCRIVDSVYEDQPMSEVDRELLHEQEVDARLRAGILLRVISVHLGRATLR